MKVHKPFSSSASSQQNYFESQYSDISKIFWIETLCSVLVHIPKAVAQQSNSEKERFFPGEVMHRSILMSEQLTWGDHTDPTARFHQLLQLMYQQ